MDTDNCPKVLFVCLGNICRSPSAEGVFRHLLERHGLADRIAVDSAGTHAYHIGELPDERAQAAARRRGITLDQLRGRQVTVKDLTHFDYVLAMDQDNLAHLQTLTAHDAAATPRLFMDFANGQGGEVPDPYFGGHHGFEQVLDMLEAAAEGLLRDIKSRYNIQ